MVSLLLHIVTFILFLPEAKFSNFWNLILEEKKPLFTTDKFLSLANEESEATLPAHLAAILHDEPDT